MNTVVGIIFLAAFAVIGTVQWLRALVEVSGLGSVKRVLPVGEYEPVILRWVRESAKGWTLTAARKGGAPVSSWLALDATVEYALGSVKERGKRSIKKNVRGEPVR